MNTSSNDSPTQEIRDEFAAAFRIDNLAAATSLLAESPTLANCDLRPASSRDDFSDGLPLHLACENNLVEMTQLLLNHSADVDALGRNPDNRPVLGMPLHFTAAEHRNYPLAHLLLDHGASPNSYPYCDKSTIEVVFYHAYEAGMPTTLVRRAFARFLPDREELEATQASDSIGADAAQPVVLFARMVDLGAQAPLKVLARRPFHDWLIEIVGHCPHADGTPHDHPKSNVFDNIFGAARWYGYPKLVKDLMQHPNYQTSYQGTIDTIHVAIGSHNRDGDYADYREILVAQLESLQHQGALEKARVDPQFNPLYTIATDFTWHRNYGYQAAIAPPESYLDLAELFVAWGFDDIDHRDPESGHSPLSAAVKRGSHPGIVTYIRWLLERGADLREIDPSEVNPISIAKEQGFSEILEILIDHSDA